MSVFGIVLLGAALVGFDRGEWRELAFRGVEPNEVRYRDGALTIKVDRSASPLIRAFPEKPKVTRLWVEGRVEGTLNLPQDKRWEPGADDAYLRVGVIAPGERRLNAAQRLGAPEWLRIMDRLFGTFSTGVGDIRCGLLVPHADWTGASRVRQDAAGFHEVVIGAPGADGRFGVLLEFDRPVTMAGLWLLADGDDSESRFTVYIDSIRIDCGPGGKDGG